VLDADARGPTDLGFVDLEGFVRDAVDEESRPVLHLPEGETAGDIEQGGIQRQSGAAANRGEPAHIERCLLPGGKGKVIAARPHVEPVPVALHAIDEAAVLPVVANQGAERAARVVVRDAGAALRNYGERRVLPRDAALDADVGAGPGWRRARRIGPAPCRQVSDPPPVSRSPARSSTPSPIRSFSCPLQFFLPKIRHVTGVPAAATCGVYNSEDVDGLVGTL